MPKKREAVADYILFDAIYEDGSQRSNRKVPATALEYHNDMLKAAKADIERQDREIAEKSGKPPIEIRSVRRSRAK
ncbi:MAG: hypothetical protein ACWA6X_04870 [Bauldia sp.]